MPSPTTPPHFLAQVAEDVIRGNLLVAHKVLHREIVVRAGVVVVDASELDLVLAELAAVAG
jgi:hypothetical protein